MKQAERRKFHYIYKITRNDGSGKYYIGMHSTDDLEDGYFGSGQLLWKSIKKHGKEKHYKEILEFLPSRKELKERERCLVNEEILNDPLCMNLKLGGEGGWDHITNEQKRRGGLRGGSVVGNKYGKINVKNLHQPEVIKKAVATRKANGSFIGRPQPHSDETRQKMSVNRMGEKNNQFGTCWVTNGVKPVKIKKEQLDEYLANGYHRGRK